MKSPVSFQCEGDLDGPAGPGHGVRDTPRMRAAVLWDVDDLRIEELDLEPPRPGEVAIRMAASGVCRSDSHAVHGVHGTRCRSCSATRVGRGRGGGGGRHRRQARRPRRLLVAAVLRLVPPVHRGTAGRVRTVGRLRRRLPRRRDDAVLARATRIHHNVPSSFAERSVVPANTVFPVDASLPLEQVALLGCAVMTGVGAVLNTAKVRPGDSVLVIGCGGVGLSAIQGARIAGATPIVAVDVVPSKLSSREELGRPRRCSPGATGSGGVDHAIECLGRTETIDQAMSAVARRDDRPGRDGRPGVRAPLDALRTTTKELTVVGSWYGSVVRPRPAAARASVGVRRAAARADDRADDRARRDPRCPRTVRDRGRDAFGDRLRLSGLGGGKPRPQASLPPRPRSWCR